MTRPTMIVNGEEVTPLTDGELQTIKAWSLRGTPTSAMFVLQLLDMLDAEREARPMSDTQPPEVRLPPPGALTPESVAFLMEHRRYPGCTMASLTIRERLEVIERAAILAAPKGDT